MAPFTFTPFVMLMPALSDQLPAGTTELTEKLVIQPSAELFVGTGTAGDGEVSVSPGTNNTYPVDESDRFSGIVVFLKCTEEDGLFERYHTEVGNNEELYGVRYIVVCVELRGTEFVSMLAVLD